MPWKPTEEQLSELKAIRIDSDDERLCAEKLNQMEIHFWRELARELRDKLGTALCYMPQGPNDSMVEFMQRTDEALR